MNLDYLEINDWLLTDDLATYDFPKKEKIQIKVPKCYFDLENGIWVFYD